MKEILFVSCFPDEIYTLMVERGIVYTQAAQKFNKLLVEGLCLNELNVDVLCVVKEPGFSFPEKYNEIAYGQQISYSFCELQGNLWQRRQKKKEFVRKNIKAYLDKNDGGGYLF